MGFQARDGVGDVDNYFYAHIGVVVIDGIVLLFGCLVCFLFRDAKPFQQRNPRMLCTSLLLNVVRSLSSLLALYYWTTLNVYLGAITVLGPIAIQQSFLQMRTSRITISMASARIKERKGLTKQEEEVHVKWFERIIAQCMRHRIWKVIIARDVPLFIASSWLQSPAILILIVAMIASPAGLFVESTLGSTFAIPCAVGAMTLSGIACSLFNCMAFFSMLPVTSSDFGLELEAGFICATVTVVTLFLAAYIIAFADTIVFSVLLVILVSAILSMYSIVICIVPLYITLSRFPEDVEDAKARGRAWMHFCRSSQISAVFYDGKSTERKWQYARASPHEPMSTSSMLLDPDSKLSTRNIQQVLDDAILWSLIMKQLRAEFAPENGAFMQRAYAYKRMVSAILMQSHTHETSAAGDIGDENYHSIRSAACDIVNDFISEDGVATVNISAALRLTTIHAVHRLDSPLMNPRRGVVIRKLMCVFDPLAAEVIKMIQPSFQRLKRSAKFTRPLAGETV